MVLKDELNEEDEERGVVDEGTGMIIDGEGDGWGTSAGEGEGEMNGVT